MLSVELLREPVSVVTKCALEEAREEDWRTTSDNREGRHRDREGGLVGGTVRWRQGRALSRGRRSAPRPVRAGRRGSGNSPIRRPARGPGRYPGRRRPPCGHGRTPRRCPRTAPPRDRPRCARACCNGGRRAGRWGGPTSPASPSTTPPSVTNRGTTPAPGTPSAITARSRRPVFRRSKRSPRGPASTACPRATDPVPRALRRRATPGRLWA